MRSDSLVATRSESVIDDEKAAFFLKSQVAPNTTVEQTFQSIQVARARAQEDNGRNANLIFNLEIRFVERVRTDFAKLMHGNPVNIVSTTKVIPSARRVYESTNRGNRFSGRATTTTTTTTTTARDFRKMPRFAFADIENTRLSTLLPPRSLHRP